ncbi:MFS transporter [Nocardia acidivorans]|uniref:MFS transporter n=1 Tax=Nocardia acidivorans TaxID=404580 RepID=UPI000832E466|nr:MFS transporter [Nocardia acidivorans]
MPGATVLRNRDFLLLWSGNALSHVGLQGARIAYPLLALILTDSPIAASLVAFAIAAPGLVFEIPAGVAADLWDRRQTLVLCQRMGLAATLLAAVVIFARPPGLAFFLAVAAFTEGTAYVFFNTAELVLVRDVITEAERPAAFAFLEAEQPIANMMGRTLGAALLGIARGLPFLANAASYLYCLWTLSRIRSRAQTPPEPVPAKSASIWDWDQVRVGMRHLGSDPFGRNAAITLGASNAIIQVLILVITLSIKQSDQPTWTVGVVLGATGVGGLLSAVPAARLGNRLNPQIVLTASLWAWTLLAVPIAVTSNPIVLGLCWMAVGFVGTMVNVPLTLYRVRVYPQELIGRIFGASKLISHGGTAAGALCSGVLVSILGPHTAGWVLVVAMALLARRARRLTAPKSSASVPADPTPPSSGNWIARVSRQGSGVDDGTGRA